MEKQDRNKEGMQETLALQRNEDEHVCFQHQVWANTHTHLLAQELMYSKSKGTLCRLLSAGVSQHTAESVATGWVYTF